MPQLPRKVARSLFLSVSLVLLGSLLASSTLVDPLLAADRPRTTASTATPAPGPGGSGPAPASADDSRAGRAEDVRDTTNDEPPAEAFDELAASAETDGTVRVLVELRDRFEPEGELNGPERADQRRRFAEQRRAVVDETRGSDARVVREYETVPLVALELGPEGIERLRRSRRVAAVEEDVADPPALAESAPLIGADDAWKKGFEGTVAAVAVLDTGVDKGHSFFGGRVTEEACFSDGGCPNGGDRQEGGGAGKPCPFSGCDHGTHVAGIAAGKGSARSGIARNTSVMSIQVFSKTSSGIGSYRSDQIAALEHVYLRRQAGVAVAAANMSLGGGSYSSNCDGDERKPVIDNLRSVGVATVVSSGNDGSKDRLSAPACISSAVSVGATTKSDKVADFSNSGKFLSLLAPGVSITSSVPGGSFSAKSGTSMSAPHVAGAWALLKGAVPAATVDQVLAALAGTGVPVSGKGVTKPRIAVDGALAALGVPTEPDDDVAPSVPGDVAAVAGSGRVVVTWSASSDDRSGVAGYRVLRDGLPSETVPGDVTTYTDTSVAPLTQYRYQVVAIDGAGNESGPSTAAVVTTPEVTESQVVLRPVADATVKRESAGKNFGFASMLQVDAEPSVASFLRFDLSQSGGGTVVAARLRIRATDSSDAGGTIHRVSNTTWGEGSITWRNQPAADTTAGPSLGPVTAGQDHEVDVTALVTGGGFVSLRLSGASPDSAAFSSREGSNPPELVLTLAA